MNKLQAAMKDKSAASWKERTMYYKIGSVFKGCAFCGDYDEEDMGNGRTRRRYTSGTQVYRAYYPKRLGWTYMCWSCSAKDSQCWENAIDLGMDAIVGNRDFVRNAKKDLRRDAARNENPTISLTSVEDARIKDLQDEIEKLKASLKKRN